MRVVRFIYILVFDIYVKIDQKRHISGAQVRKFANNKEEKEAILFSKIPRLNDFFFQTNKQHYP